MLICLKKKAQSTAEYVMLFAIVVGGVTMVTSYVKKALAGKIQEATKTYLGGATLYQDADPSSSHASKGTQRSAGDNVLANSGAYNENDNKGETMRISVVGDVGTAAAGAADAVDVVSDADTWGNKAKVPDAPTKF